MNRQADSQSAASTPSPRLENLFDGGSSSEADSEPELAPPPPPPSQPRFPRPMGVNWPRKAVRSPEADPDPSTPDANVEEAEKPAEGEEEAESQDESSEEEEEQIEDIGSDYAPSVADDDGAKGKVVSCLLARST